MNTELPQPGDRIEFVRHIKPDFDPLPEGIRGTVIISNEWAISVDWDEDKRGLSLIPDGDEWRIVESDDEMSLVL